MIRLVVFGTGGWWLWKRLHLDLDQIKVMVRSLLPVVFEMGAVVIPLFLLMCAYKFVHKQRVIW